MKKLILILFILTSCAHNRYEPQTYAQMVKKIDYSKVYIRGPLDSTSMNKFYKDIQYMEENTKPNQEITIFINSTGGFVTVSYKMYEIVKDLTKTRKVNTVVLKDCMSGCIPILQAGTKRIMKKDSVLMLHKPSITLEIPVTEDGIPAIFQDYIKYYQYRLMLDQKFNNLCVERLSDDNKKKVLKEMKGDYFVKPKKALELGLIDLID